MQRPRWPVPSPPCSSRFPPLDCRTTLASLPASCSTLGRAISCRRHTATRVPLLPWPSQCLESFSPLSSRAWSEQRGDRSDRCTTSVFTTQPTLFLTHSVYAMRRFRLYWAITAPSEQGQETATIDQSSYT